MKNLNTKTNRGRKPRVVTPEMIADLSSLKIDEYCEKHNASEAFFLKLYYKNVSPVKEHKDEKVETKHPFVAMFDDVLADAHILLEAGYSEWFKHISKMQQITDYKKCDISHKIEISKCSQVEKIALYDMYREACIENRKYDDSFTFANKNQNKIIDALSLVKDINDRKNLLDVRGYKVRIMKKEFGEYISGDKE